MANKDIKIKIKAVNKTRRAFMAVTAGLGGIAKAAFSMKTAIGLAAGALGIGFLIKRSMDATDELAKTARAIGLSVTELQRFQYAAELGGVESKALNKAMQKLAINISDVAGGTGEAKDAFERYGISAKNADGSTRSVSDVMGQAATALEGMTNKTDRASFVYDLFGARGAKVINMLQDGKAAMEAMKAEADSLGLVMSGALIQGVEDANDAILRLTSYLGNVFHRVVASLAPIITEATDALRNFVQMKIDDSGGIAQFSREMAVNVVKASRSMVKAFTAVTNSIIRFSNALGSATNIYEKMFGDKRTIESINKQIASTVQQLEMLANISKGNDPLIASQAPQVAQLELTILALKELISTGEVLSTNLITPQIDDSAALGILDSLEARLSKITDSNVVTDVSTTGSTLVDLTPKPTADKHAREYEQALDHDRRMVEFRKKIAAREEMDRNKSIELTHQYLSKQSAIQKAIQEALRNTSTTISEDIIASYKSTTDSIESTLTDAMMGTKSWGESMKDIFRQVAREYVLTNMARPLIKSFTNSILPSFDGGGFTGGGSRSGGVDGKGGFNAVLHPNETVVDHTKPQGDSSGVQNITFNITANDTRGFDQLLQQRRGQIIGMVNQAMNDRGQRAIA